MINAQQTEKAAEIILSIKKEFAPDKRVVLFDVSPLASEASLTLKGETTSPGAKQALIAKLNESGIIFTDSINVLPSEEFAGRARGVVTLSVANMRTKPDHPAEMASQALMGTPLKVYKKHREWYLVQTPDNYLGWMDDDGFELMTDSEFVKWDKSEKIFITQNYTLGFENTTVTSGVVTDLVAGDILVKTGNNDGFAQAMLPDGRKCFVKDNDYKNLDDWINSINPESISPESILMTAKQYMGVPYLWGGTSAKGLDCSGFTKTVFYLNGVVLPRDASQQVHVGNLVDAGDEFENLLPGDLLFFGEKSTDTTKERITHVAIYLGNKDFIHASGRVKINSFDSSKKIFAPNRLRGFVRAKRLLPNANLPGIIPVKSLINM